MCGEHDFWGLSYKTYFIQQVEADGCFSARVNVREISLRNCDRFHMRVTV
jgi:hypothetical protein